MPSAPGAGEAGVGRTCMMHACIRRNRRFLGRYICVYERVCMDLDYMAWYISFPQYVLQILVVTMRVRSLFKITISGTIREMNLQPARCGAELVPKFVDAATARTP